MFKMQKGSRWFSNFFILSLLCYFYNILGENCHVILSQGKIFKIICISVQSDILCEFLLKYTGYRLRLYKRARKFGLHAGLSRRTFRLDFEKRHRYHEDFHSLSLFLGQITGEYSNFESKFWRENWEEAGRLQSEFTSRRRCQVTWPRSFFPWYRPSLHVLLPASIYNESTLTDFIYNRIVRSHTQRYHQNTPAFDYNEPDSAEKWRMVSIHATVSFIIYNTSR